MLTKLAPVPKEDRAKPSKAVIASYDGDGCVLQTVGPHLDSWMDYAGSRRLSDLDLNAPDGISIWEGVIKTTHIHTPDCNEYDSYPVGTFRPPTPEEWAFIMRGECPWDSNEWLLPDPPTE